MWNDPALMPEQQQPKVPKPPPGTGKAGRRVWRQLHAAVAPGWELDERDLAVLEQAVAQADLIAELETAIKAEGVLVVGAAGQRRPNGLMTQLTSSRALLAKLIAQVQIAPPMERTGNLSKRQRDQLRDARRQRWPRQDSRLFADG